MKICFLDNSIISYKANNLNLIDIKEAENIIINLSQELVKFKNYLLRRKIVKRDQDKYFKLFNE